MRTDAMLVQDREDLIALLRMRFGNVDPQIIETIYQVEQIDILERLMMVVANAQAYGEFLQELNAENIHIQVTSRHFSLIENMANRGVMNDKKDE